MPFLLIPINCLIFLHMHIHTHILANVPDNAIEVDVENSVGVETLISVGVTGFLYSAISGTWTSLLLDFLSIIFSTYDYCKIMIYFNNITT